MIRVLAFPVAARLTRTPRAWMTVGAWCVLAVGFALVARSGGSTHGADHALVGAFGALVVPLLSYAVVGALLGGRSLRAAVAPAVAFGAPPVRAAAITVGVAVAGCATLGLVLAALVALVAHGADDPPAAWDALEAAYAGALGGGAYAALFSFGGSLGARGSGRTWLLVADWLLGMGRGAVSFATPRAHLRNLLGGAAPLELPSRASGAILLALAALFAAAAVLRARRPSR